MINVHFRDGVIVSADGDRIVYTPTDPRVLAVMNGSGVAMIMLADDFEYATVS